MEELIRGRTLAVRKFGLDAVEASDWWLMTSRRHGAVCLTDPVPKASGDATACSRATCLVRGRHGEGQVAG